jgi:hypothetical protein
MARFRRSHQTDRKKGLTAIYLKVIFFSILLFGAFALIYSNKSKSDSTIDYQVENDNSPNRFYPYYHSGEVYLHSDFAMCYDENLYRAVWFAFSVENFQYSDSLTQINNHEKILLSEFPDSIVNAYCLPGQLFVTTDEKLKTLLASPYLAYSIGASKAVNYANALKLIIERFAHGKINCLIVSGPLSKGFETNEFFISLVCHERGIQFCKTMKVDLEEDITEKAISPISPYQIEEKFGIVLYNCKGIDSQ